MDKKLLKNFRDQVTNCVDFEIVNSTTLGMLNAHIAGKIVFLSAMSLPLGLLRI